MSIKKSFKLLLTTSDSTKYTGSRSNANFPVNLLTLGLTPDDLNKRYKMTFWYRSTNDTLLTISNSNSYYITITLNNGSIQRRIYNNLTQILPTGILKIQSDTTNNYLMNTFLTVSGTISPNVVQLGSNAGLVAGQLITFYGTGSIYSGVDFGGLVNGRQYIISSVNSSNQITLTGIVNLTTSSGTMNAITNYNYQMSYLEALPNDNPPTYIDSLSGINNVNIQVNTSSYGLLSTSINNNIVLFFEEI